MIIHPKVRSSASLEVLDFKAMHFGGEYILLRAFNTQAKVDILLDPDEALTVVEYILKRANELKEKQSG